MFLTKKINHYFQKGEFNSTTGDYHLIEIPTLCPLCGVGFGPNNAVQSTFNSGEDFFIFMTHKCNVCSKYSLSLQKVNGDETNLLILYPKGQERSFDTLICDLSPRFVTMYNSAFKAEQNESIDLAGIGYRAAMELLIKDYALEFELASYEEIAKLNLNRAIDKFFRHDTDGFISADVVRILGNGYAHWDKNEQELDLQTLKAYLDIFIQTIYSKLLIKHPPVARDKNHPK
ncbi:hypothetical protein CKY11_06465 [Enterococcus hirae]|uniref:DUF4145 domain-containing protein n=1 Tax=Enterococcus hirae TaxID=1354 RepID=UPI000BBBCE97|nr:DUF4145 domain-containing protein [Enterococcus hirae]PCE01364.1 hypothetical protein CKY11_06465 [Enterococcus hirae]